MGIFHYSITPLLHYSITPLLHYSNTSVMIHFAYPNVIPRESRFLGCGRYVAALLGEAPDESYKLVELNIPNITEVHLAALQLAPEAVDSKKVIYERRDASSHSYLGESRDFAYVLALISRSRPICLSEDRIRGDIWCTGCIDIKGENRPFLKAVDMSGFSCKLEAFLSEENPDRLFLVPAQNVLPTHEVLFQKSDVNVVSLKQFQHNLSTVQEIFAKKVIVKIQGDELERLVNVLFEIPELKQKAPHPVIGINPYRGLFAFQEQDAEFFFGRELYTKRLIEAVRNKPFVAVIGPSGIGKSSVVNAGLIPQLRRQNPSKEGQNTIALSSGLKKIPPNPPLEKGGKEHIPPFSKGGLGGILVDEHPSPGWVNWLIATFRPGTDPFRALSSALLPLLEPEKSEVEQLVEIKRMTENLKSGHLNLEDVLEAILSKNPDSHLLLCADQFEELYTLCREEDERHRFLDELLSILPISPSPHPPISSLVLTIRADFLGKAFSYRPFADVLQDASLILGPMNHEELREVIEKPAEKCGINIEDGLTDRILEAISGEPGHLPLLEFALAQLWEKQTQLPSTYGILSHAAYDDIGGVEQALAYYAERVYENLTWQEQRQTQQIFTQLVHPGEGTEDTRRIATRSDVGEGNWELVTKLADARLVVTSSPSFLKGGQGGFDTTMGEIPPTPPLEKGGTEETVEVVHEALIQGWQRLHKWIETDREFRTWQEHLRTAIHQWKESNYDEGALLRGVPLGEAEDWLGKKRDSLSRYEQDFIESSLQARKRLKRRYQIGIMTGFVISIVIALFFMALWNNAETQRRVAEIAAIKAQIQTLHALFLSKEDDLGALLVGIKAGKNSNRVVLPTKLKNQILFNLREVVYGIHEKNRLEGHELPVKSVKFSPDGTLLVSGSNDGTIRLWNVADGNELMTLYGHFGSVRSVAFSPDGMLLASGGEDATIRLWNVADGQERMTLISAQPGFSKHFPVKTFSLNGGVQGRFRYLKNMRRFLTTHLYGHADAIRSVHFSPDSKLLASGSANGVIKLWNVEDGRELMTLQGHSGAVWSISFSPDSTRLASGSEDGTIKLWDVNDGREMLTLHAFSGTVWNISFSPDSTRLASGSEDGTIKLWNTTDGHEIMTLHGHSDAVRSVSFSPDGMLLASGSDEFDCTIKFWNVANGREVNTLKGHYNSVVSLSFSPDGTLLASGSDDNTIKLWDITDSGELATLHTYTENVASVMFSPDGTILASGNHDNTITLWDVKNNRELMTLQGHSSVVRSISFSPDGTLLASGSNDKTIKLWHVGDGREVMTLRGHDGAIQSLNFSSDGHLLVSGSNDHTIKLWDVADGSEVTTLHGHSDAVLSIRLSSNGTLLASGSEDGTIKLWHVGEGRKIRTLSAHANAIRSLAFSPDGTLLASGGDDHKIRLWNVTEGRQVRTLKGHSHTLLSLDFSPDGTLLASGSYDHTIKLWSVADGSEVTTLQGHSDAVSSLDFSPDGTILASGSYDHTIKLWNFDLDDLLVRGCEKLHSYLKNNPNVSDEDRLLCDDIVAR